MSGSGSHRPFVRLIIVRYPTREALFEALSHSSFRRGFRLNHDDRLYAETRSEELLKRHAQEILKKRIGDAEPSNDGSQTPYKGHPVFTAQHATGCCCRSCLYKWHGIAKGRELTASEIEELSEDILEWIRRDLKKPPKKKRLKKGETGDLFDL